MLGGLAAPGRRCHPCMRGTPACPAARWGTRDSAAGTCGPPRPGSCCGREPAAPRRPPPHGPAPLPQTPACMRITCFGLQLSTLQGQCCALLSLLLCPAGGVFGGLQVWRCSDTGDIQSSCSEAACSEGPCSEAALHANTMANSTFAACRLRA